MQDQMIFSETTRSGAVSALFRSLVTRAEKHRAHVMPVIKAYGPMLVVMVFVGLTILFAPDTASAQSSVWTSLNNVNSNAQSTLLKVMVTVGILMIIIGAFMYKQEKGGAMPVLLLGVVLIVVGGLTASSVLSGIGATGGSGSF